VGKAWWWLSILLLVGLAIALVVALCRLSDLSARAGELEREATAIRGELDESRLALDELGAELVGANGAYEAALRSVESNRMAALDAQRRVAALEGALRGVVDIAGELGGLTGESEDIARGAHEEVRRTLVGLRLLQAEVGGD
jgi:hypothetical protein